MHEGLGIHWTFRNIAFLLGIADGPAPLSISGQQKTFFEIITADNDDGANSEKLGGVFRFVVI
jgi:hypothetical protein